MNRVHSCTVISIWLAFALLTACGQPEQATDASSVPRSAAVTPESITPARPTSLPTPTSYAPPPTPTLPLAQALSQLGPHTFLYRNPTNNSILMLADVDSGQHIPVTAGINDSMCDSSQRGEYQYALWSPDGRFLAITCATQGEDIFWHDGLTVNYLLDLHTGEFTLLTPTASETDQRRLWIHAWSPDGQRLLVRQQSIDVLEHQQHSEKAPIRWFILDVATGTRTELLGFDRQSSATWSPDGQQVALAGDRSHEYNSDLYLINGDGSNLRLIAQPQQAAFIDCCRWSHDGQFVYFSTRTISPHDRGTALRFNVMTNELRTLRTRPVTAVSPDNRHYLAISWIEPMSMLTYPFEWTVHTADGHFVEEDYGGAAWLPDGRFVASICNLSVESSQITIIDLQGSREIIATYSDTCTGVFPSTDGSLLAVTYEKQIDILNMQGEFQMTVKGRFNEVHAQNLPSERVTIEQTTWRPGQE